MKITVAQFRDVHNQCLRAEISYSRMVEILNEIKLGAPLAYEYHNHKTGHCFVDYDLGEAIPEGIENIKDYIKTPLYKL